MRRYLPFMRLAKIWMGISVLTLVVAVVSLATRGVNLGIDYRGGTQLEIHFDQPRTVPEVREAVARSVGSVPTVRQAELKGATTGAEFLITTASLTAEQRDQLRADLEKALGKFEVVSESEVSPTIRRELIEKALLAVAIAAVLQLIYIAIRFEFKFGVAAVIALLHDAVVLLGFFSLLGMEVGPAFLAAVLTVIGYSINDTIVVFDRIRENLHRPRKGEPLEALVDRSINETLVRSLNTAGTTLMAIAAILFFGGETTRDFALALFVGILSGTYSSIFVASPIWFWWKRAEKHQPGTKAVLAR